MNTETKKPAHVALNSIGANNTTGTRGARGMFANKDGINKRTTVGTSQQQASDGARAGKEDAGDLGGTATQQA